MEITKVVKPFIRRGRPSTFGNIVCIHTGAFNKLECHGKVIYFSNSTQIVNAHRLK